ncbi:hypothetical protein BP5796_09375 [Coleophoma crateriformis]|uniref:Uncharacterized protein n=1 Tax=Coleophoma crateriformis TaxID=565419 RepID=A0A3D8QXW1_9HELO|nr:hypothetical protein BP5796_09375 [Coleophoma crateriformis]
MLWWDIIYPVDGPTVVYTVIEGTNSTIGSRTVPSSTNATLPASILSTLQPYLADGNVETDMVTDTSETLTQEIIFEFISTKLETWATLTTSGGLTSECVLATPVSVPSEYTYFGTSSVLWNHTNPNNSNDAYAEEDPNATSALQSYLASILGPPNCTVLIDDGIAGLKVGVSLLTTPSTVYQTPAAIVTSSAPSLSTLSTLSTTSAPASPAKSPTTTLPTATTTPTSTAVSEPTSSSTADVTQSTPSTAVIEPTTPSTTDVTKSPASTAGNGSLGGGQGGSSNQGGGLGSGSQPSAVSPTSTSDGGVSTGQVPSPSEITTAQIGTSSFTIVILPSSSGFIIGDNHVSAGSSAVAIGGATVTADSGGLGVLTTPTGTDSSGVVITSYVVPGTEILSTTGISSLFPSVTASSAELKTPITSTTGLPNSITSELDIAVPTSPAVIIGSHTFAASTLSGGGILVAGQTLTEGGNVVVASATISLASGSNAIVIGGSTTEALLETQTVMVSTLSGGGIVVSGQTLSAGGNVILGGQTVSLAPGVGSVVVGGSTTEGLVRSITSTGGGPVGTTTSTGVVPAQFTGGADKKLGHIGRERLGLMILAGVVLGF